MSRLRKKDIVAKLDGTRRENEALVDLVFETIKETLESGEEVHIHGFGKFTLQDKPPREGRNPQTGEPVVISGRRVVSFKWGDKLRDDLNG